MIIKINKHPLILYNYFTKDLIKYFLFILFFLITIIFFIDLIELFRRSSNKIGVSYLQQATLIDILGMAALKIPLNIEKILPFASLIGSVACFNQWRKKNYYIITRISGISLWKILSPILVSFFVVGVASIIAINPFSTLLNKKYDLLQTKFFGKKTSKTFSFDTKGFWLKQASQKNSLLINANKINQTKNTIIDVNIFVFDEFKKFEKRLSAKNGRFLDNALKLYDVQITNKNSKTEKFKSYSFSINDFSNSFKIAISKPDTIFILDLPSYILKMKKYGLNTSRHLLHLFKLICQPFLIISMILLSASLMLRSSERKVEIGIVSFSLVVGFSLYFIGDIIFALGSSEKLPALLSGFAPTLIGLFSGCYLVSDIDEPRTIWKPKE